jgi:hypothetical protein
LLAEEEDVGDGRLDGLCAALPFCKRDETKENNT